MRWRRRSMVGPVPEPEGDRPDDLGGECEAFLRGDYVSWADEAGLTVPPWARLNRAAHGSYDDILRGLRIEDLPEHACCFRHGGLLVEALVVAFVEPDFLPAVQRDLLIPLELELMASPLSPRAVLAYLTERLV